MTLKQYLTDLWQYRIARTFCIMLFDWSVTTNDVFIMKVRVNENSSKFTLQNGSFLRFMR